jgi:hypothetical protein
MRELYGDEVGVGQLAAVEAELNEVVARLGELPPAMVVWGAEDRGAQPPWGDAIAPTITSLANYWWTSDGRDFRAVLREAIVSASTRGEPIRIE